MKQYKVITAFGSLEVGDIINADQLTGDADINSRISGGFIEAVEVSETVDEAVTPASDVPVETPVATDETAAPSAPAEPETTESQTA